MEKAERRQDAELQARWGSGSTNGVCGYKLRRQTGDRGGESGERKQRGCALSLNPSSSYLYPSPCLTLRAAIHLSPFQPRLHCRYRHYRHYRHTSTTTWLAARLSREDEGTTATGVEMERVGSWSWDSSQSQVRASPERENERTGVVCAKINAAHTRLPPTQGSPRRRGRDPGHYQAKFTRPTSPFRRLAPPTHTPNSHPPTHTAKWGREEGELVRE